MCERKRAGALLRLKLRQQAGKPRVVMGYLMGCVVAAVTAARYVGFSAGWEIGVLEPYVLLMNYWSNMALLLLGFYLVISDAPFVDGLSQSMMLRSGWRHSWTRAMIWYLFFHCVLYWSAVLLASMLPCIFASCGAGNEWSEPLCILIEVKPSNAIVKWKLNFFSGELLRSRKPYEAALLSYVLSVVHGFDMALIVYAFNLGTGKPVGSLAALGILFWGALVIYNSDMIPVACSPLAHAMLDFHGKNGISLRVSAAFFGAALPALLLLVKRISETCDFRVVNSERLW